jgi:hypothetical protein
VSLVIEAEGFGDEERPPNLKADQLRRIHCLKDLSKKASPVNTDVRKLLELACYTKCQKDLDFDSEVDREVCLGAIYAPLRFHRDLHWEISRRDGAIHLSDRLKSFRDWY